MAGEGEYGGPARHTRAQAPLPPQITLEELEAVLNFDDEEIQAQADQDWDRFLEVRRALLASVTFAMAAPSTLASDVNLGCDCQAVQAPCLDDLGPEDDDVDSDFELDLDAMVAGADGQNTLQVSCLCTATVFPLTFRMLLHSWSVLSSDDNRPVIRSINGLTDAQDLSFVTTGWLFTSGFSSCLYLLLEEVM
jgi:hypothetical protein